MIIEKEIIKYLAGKIDVSVTAEKPKNKPPEYILVQKIDGGMADRICNATINITAHAESMLKAAELSDKVEEVMLIITETDEVMGVEFAGARNSANEALHVYTYETTWNVYF